MMGIGCECVNVFMCMVLYKKKDEEGERGREKKREC